MNRQEVEKQIDRLARRSYWIGAVAGLVLGIIAGIVIGYHFGSDTTIVIPLNEGVKV